MIINNSKRFIFIHIPKCGGTTVSHVLEKKLRPQDVNLGVNPNQGWGEFVTAYRKRFKLTKHSTATEISAAMGKEDFKTYYAFTFSRNPFARAYSAFTFTKKADAKHRPDSERYQEIKDMGFEEFLKSRYMQEKLILPSRSQLEWITGAPGKVHVFKLEDISDNLNVLMTKFFGETVDDEHVRPRNPSAREDEWKNMSEEAESIIRDLYREDFDALSYEDRILRS